MGDAAFTAANGVVGGTGTPADPYVVSGWLIDTPSAAAVTIRSTTKHVVVRDNVLLGGAGASTVDLRDNSGLVRVRDNTIEHRGTGVSALGGRTIVEGNSIRDVGGVTGVSVRGGEAYVANGTFTANDRAGFFQAADVRVESVTVVSGLEGFQVHGGEAVLAGNTILSTGRAVSAEGAADVTVQGGLLARPSIGIHARQSSVAATAVRIEAATQFAALLEDGLADLQGLAVVGGAVGVQVARGRADVAASSFDAVLGVAVRFVDATGSVSNSGFLANGGGVALDGASLVSVGGNAMADNEWGLGIAYASRSSIPLLGVNAVNGYDASLSYHWREANVVVTGTVDSGFGAGYYGSLTREGLVVLYEVDTAAIAATLTHGTVGVHAVSSFNVGVEGSLLLSNDCGVLLNATVGFVKNTTIDIPVDPPATCGVRVSGGVGVVHNNTIRRVDVGVLVEGNAKANVSGNFVTETFVGVSVVGGSPGNVSVHGNVLLANFIGLELKAKFDGTVSGNDVRANTRAGVRIDGAASVAFTGNVVVRNLRGVEDVTVCTSAAGKAARVRLTSNVVANNTDFGMRVNASVVARGNAFVDNGDDGLVVCGHIDGRADVYARNGEDGLEVRGSADLDGEVAIHNRFGAGMRFQGTLFVILRANVSANFDGIVGNEPLPIPEVPNPGTPQVPRLPTVCVCVNVDPIWVHLSKITANTRWAVVASLQTDVNATHNWWGSPDGPDHAIPQFAEFGNVVGPNVRFAPWYRNEAMTDRAPV